MEISHQPFDGGLGDTLIERLGSGRYTRFEFMVAFAKQSGVLRLKQALETFRDAGGSISAFVGIDMDGTSHDALSSLSTLCDELYVVHTETISQTFHSKVYTLTGSDSVWVTVASHNLTYSGLWQNFESSATDVFDLSGETGKAKAARLSRRFADLRDVTSGVSRLLTGPADVDELLHHGYVKTEASINTTTRKRQKGEVRRARLFATQVEHSPGPAVATAATTAASPALAPGAPGRPAGTAAATPVVARPTPPAMSTWVGEVFWAESRKMTSAARNQLDLSMTGRVVAGSAADAGYEDRPGWAVGSVAFFGVDPTVQSDERRVTLNYRGVDYEGNRVYFPTSAGANGTWRIQLNGTDASDRRLDYVVGRDGYVDKVLAFQRIDDDYYTLTILPESHLDGFQTASHFVATSGVTSKGRRYGILTAVE